MPEEKEKEKEKTLSESSSARWWDFYFVRYCMGTIVGSALVLMVLSSKTLPPNVSPDFWTKLYSLLTDQPYGLIILPIIGLSYCYIASAPILVYHACRSAIVQFNEKNIFFILITLVAIFIAVFFSPYFSDKTSWISGMAAVFIIGSQILFIFLSFNIRSDSYKKLCDRKAKAKSKPSDLEFIESYKHLREHGNAFMILMMEIFLAVILYGAVGKGYFMVVLPLWIFPAAYVWFIGNYLEKTLTE